MTERLDPPDTTPLLAEPIRDEDIRLLRAWELGHVSVGPDKMGQLLQIQETQRTVALATMALGAAEVVA